MSPSLRKNAALNTLKTLCQVIFPIITIPYVSRVLETENYGKVSFTASMISYFVLFASFGINHYATREGARIREDKKAFGTFANQIFTISLITSGVSIVALLFVAFGISTMQNYRTLLLIQGTAMLFTALGADWVNSVFEDFQFITIRYIIIQVISVTLMLLLVNNRDDYLKYAAIITFSSVGANLFNIVYIRRYTHLKPDFSRLLKSHIKPMLLIFGASLTITIFVNSDNILLGMMKGDYDVGIYSVAAKVYLAVKQVLNAVILVAAPRISSILKRKAWEEYNELLNSILHFLLFIVLPCVTGLFMLSEPLILIAAGNGYADSVLPMKLLSFSLFFSVFDTFFMTCILLPNKRDKERFIASLAGCVFNVVLNILIIPKWSYIGTAATTLAAEMLVMCLTGNCARSLFSVKIRKKTVVAVILGCGSIVAVCVLSQHFINSMLWGGITAIVLSVLSYVAILLSLEKNMLKQVWRRFRV